MVTKPSKSLRGLHVLTVDDSADNLDLVSFVLRKSGARVTEAHSVAEAMMKFEKDPPQVIITDVEMPGESGYDLLKKVRSRDGKMPPVIALTSHRNLRELHNANSAEFDAVLNKLSVTDGLIPTILRNV